MAEKVYVLCATDENYAPYCGVMLTSVFENTPNAEAFVFISNSLSERNQKKYQQLEKQYNTSIHFIAVNKSHFAQMPMGLGTWTIEAYYRLAAPELLPKEIEKVIYLDCDIIVNDDLHELWDIPLDNYSVSAVSDINYDPNLYKHLGYPSERGYFNSGMMVINLKYWRKHNIQEQLFKTAREKADTIMYVDQDVLNMVLSETKKIMPMEYNFMPASYSLHYYETFPDTVKEMVLNINPKIIHYTSGLIRPWHACSYGLPLRSIWWKYAKKSPWKKMREKYPQRKRINWWIKRQFFMPLGLYLQNQNIIVTTQVPL